MRGSDSKVELGLKVGVEFDQKNLEMKFSKFSNRNFFIFLCLGEIGEVKFITLTFLLRIQP